jgi:histidinol phosphatase-like PHP family hydrolase
LVTHSKPRPRGRKQAAAELAGALLVDDPNILAAGFLYDMAAIQSTERSRFGYKRAAQAVVRLPVSIRDLVRAGTIREIPYVGPASARIIVEAVAQGASPTVEAAIAVSTRRSDILKRRAFRTNFLSEHAMQQALSMRLPGEVVTREAFRGDFQMHTTWSDGAESIDTMVEACLALGLSCLGVTDHSHGLPIARGMSMDAARAQASAVDEVNSVYAGRFRVFRGIEANIRGDGSLDLSPDERRTFEFVVASPHALLRREEDQTERMLSAVRTPGVAILGHPRGRIYNSRGGVSADWTRVFAEAAEREVAIELDGNWHRQDVDWPLAAQALEAGCIFALDSDAHSIAELRFTDYSIAHARLARIPSDRVINCWPDARLEAWMERRIRGC